MDLVARILELDEALTEAGIPHAFGGALALAWCTRRARGTIDIDVNVFVDIASPGSVFAAAGTLDVETVLGALVHHLGGDDPRIERLRARDET